MKQPVTTNSEFKVYLRNSTLDLDDYKIEKEKFFRSLWFAALFLIVLITVKSVETIFHISFAQFGLYPLTLKGLQGILFAPLIHGSWEHLANNSIPLFVLTVTLFYFYREISLKVFFLIYFIHDFWLWFFGRSSYHIGSSGIIYGLGAFLFVSGLIRKNSHLLAISLLVVFLYGSMIWGIFPLIESVSWEAHLSGMVCGIILAFYYRNYGPPSNIDWWKSREAEDIDTENEIHTDDYLEKLRDQERKSDTT